MTTVLTPAEVARILQVSETTVRRLVRSGRLERLPGLGLVRIPARSVEAYIDGHDGRTRNGDDRRAPERRYWLNFKRTGVLPFS